jgi:hypothetical protein
MADVPPSGGFPKCHRPQHIVPARLLSYCVLSPCLGDKVSTKLFPSNGRCHMFTQLLLANGSTCRNTFACSLLGLCHLHITKYNR